MAFYPGMHRLALHGLLCVICCLLGAAGFRPAFAADAPAPVHGLWVWKSQSVLAASGGAEMLRDFCRSAGVNEAYVSVSARRDEDDDRRLAHLIELLHRSGIRVEALLSSIDADEPGKPRTALLAHVDGIRRFNQAHAADRFDGIHLDIEPQQRPENKGPGNLRFLPGLVEAYLAVRALAEPAGMSVDADIQNKLLKGDQGERRMLLSALPRLTLMLYELSKQGDGDAAEKLRQASRDFLDMGYRGLAGPNLARLIVGLRTPDYGAALPQMLGLLDEEHRADPHYLGWARHSYNDHLAGAP